MRRVSSRQRLVSWDAFDATEASSSPSPNGDDKNQLNGNNNNDDDDDDSSSWSDYETCYDTLPPPPTSPTTPATAATAAAASSSSSSAAVAVATKMMMNMMNMNPMMNRVSSIGSNLSLEDNSGGSGAGLSSFLKRKRGAASRSKLLAEPRPASAPMTAAASSTMNTTSSSTRQEEADDKQMTSSPSPPPPPPPPTLIPTFPWEVLQLAPSSSFYSVHGDEDDVEEVRGAPATPPPSSSKTTTIRSTASSSTTSNTAAPITTNITSLLPDDVQLHMLSFLAIDDVRTMTQTGRWYQRLIFETDEADGLWKNLCRQQWSYLDEPHGDDDDDSSSPGTPPPAAAAAATTSHVNSTMNLVDTLHIVGSRQQHQQQQQKQQQQQQQPDSSNNNNNNSSRPDLNLLLRLAADSECIPTLIDKTLFQKPRRYYATRSRITTTTMAGAGGGEQRIVSLRTIRTSALSDAVLPAVVELQERPVLVANGVGVGGGVVMAVQFTGTVGTGDRCIRANHPLPRPKLLTKAQLRAITSRQQRQEYGAAAAATPSSDAASMMVDSKNATELSFVSPSSVGGGGGGGSFMQRLRRTSRRLASSASASSCYSYSPYSYASAFAPSAGQHGGGVVKPIWQPFVAPFYTRSTNAEKPNSTVVSVTPRLVAYFEVSILAAPAKTAQDVEEERRRRREQQQQQQQQRGQHHQRMTTTVSTTECVAVGLARGEFSLHTRMPGWDADSYGYHGDDGGIFHNAGHMIRPFGPKFGVGDVVGCGIDYQEQSIFYTLNGTFLGYAFDKIDATTLATQDLYPVVGMDTNCLVQVNFGTNPNGPAFQYNLQAKMDSHKQVICEALRPITNM
jgi:SPRY domain